MQLPLTLLRLLVCSPLLIAVVASGDGALLHTQMTWVFDVGHGDHVSMKARCQGAVYCATSEHVKEPHVVKITHGCAL